MRQSASHFGVLTMLQIFCEVAYVAKTPDHLVDGIDEFIDDLTVLPPSIWDPTTRMEPPQKTISMVGVRQRLRRTAKQETHQEMRYPLYFVIHLAFNAPDGGVPLGRSP